MDADEINESIKINKDIKKMLIEELNKKNDNINKIEILEKIKKIDENINFYKNLIENKSKQKYSIIIFLYKFRWYWNKNDISIKNKKKLLI